MIPMEVEGAKLPEEALLFLQEQELAFDQGVCIVDRRPAGEYALEVLLSELEGELEGTAAIAEDEWTEVTLTAEYTRDYGQVAVLTEFEGDVFRRG